MKNEDWTQERLQYLEERIQNLIISLHPIMPKSFGKAIAMYYPDARIRKLYANFIGIQMGEGTYANLGIKVVPNIHPISIYIGKNVSIAPNVIFLSGTEPNNGVEIKEIPYVKEKLSYYEDTIVEDEAWIGASVVIFPGLRIGRCSIIGAGSVVTKDVEPYSIYAGIPAKKIRSLKE